MVCASGNFTTDSVLMQRHISNPDCIPGFFRSQLGRAGKTTNPDDLVSARDYRPGFTSRPGDVPLLKNLLDLLGAFGVRGPEFVPRPPVSHPQFVRQLRRIQQAVWIISRTIAL